MFTMVKTNTSFKVCDLEATRQQWETARSGKWQHLYICYAYSNMHKIWTHRHIIPSTLWTLQHTFCIKCGKRSLKKHKAKQVEGYLK